MLVLGGLVAALVLIAPVTAAVAVGWAGWAAVLIAAGAFLLVLAPRVARAGRVAGVASLALVALGASFGFGGGEWLMLFVLLALGCGAVLPVRWAPYATGVVAVAGTVVAGVVDGDWQGAMWGTGLTALLAGITAYGFRRLVEIIGELTRTRKELADAAVSRERVRFSRDLHDLLGHTLSVIVVKAEAVRRLAPVNAEVAAAQAGDIEAIGRQALDEVRQAVHGYREATLARELANARTALSAAGIACAIDDFGPELPGETDALLSWVVREAVTNVVRHSGARTCRITIRRATDPVTAEIIDDGKTGGDGQPDPPGSAAGLRGLSERLATAGGSLQAARPASGGFRLTAALPAGPQVECS